MHTHSKRPFFSNCVICIKISDTVSDQKNETFMNDRQLFEDQFEKYLFVNRRFDSFIHFV